MSFRSRLGYGDLDVQDDGVSAEMEEGMVDAYTKTIVENGQPSILHDGCRVNN